MKSKSLNIAFLFILVQSICNSQIPIFEIENRDTNYLNQVIFENGDSIDIWDFKNNLVKGKYFVVENHKCGKDTLMVAEFLEDNVKHGEWKEWEERICGGTIEQDGSIKNWEYWSDKELSKIEVYDSNSIIKSVSFHFGSNQPHIEHTYPKGALELFEWNTEKVWTENGILRWEKYIGKKGKMKHIDYYSNGNIRAQGELEHHGTFQEPWVYYYPNGKLMAKGKFEEFGKGKVRYYTGERIPKDEWNYWDESGFQIAKVIFKAGEIIDLKKFQDKAIPFPEIEQMIFKE